MAGKSKVTTDHDEIRKWVEERGGKPSSIKGTEKKGDDAGLLRINFPGYTEDNLDDITWDGFFDKFEGANLAFLYQEETTGGVESRFNKFISRDSDAAKND